MYAHLAPPDGKSLMIYECGWVEIMGFFCRISILFSYLLKDVFY